MPWYGGLATTRSYRAFADQAHEADARGELLAAQAEAEVVRRRCAVEEALQPAKQGGLGFGATEWTPPLAPWAR